MREKETDGERNQTREQKSCPCVAARPQQIYDLHSLSITNQPRQPSSPSPGVGPGRSYRSGAPHVALRLSGVCLHPPDQPQTTTTAQNLPTDLPSPMQFFARTDKYPQIDWSSSGRVEAISPKHNQGVRVWPSKADEVGNYPAEALTPRSTFPPVTGLGADDPLGRQSLWSCLVSSWLHSRAGPWMSGSPRTRTTVGLMIVQVISSAR